MEHCAKMGEVEHDLHGAKLHKERRIRNAVKHLKWSVL